jgi:hypothetical protein
VYAGEKFVSRESHRTFRAENEFIQCDSKDHLISLPAFYIGFVNPQAMRFKTDLRNRSIANVDIVTDIRKAPLFFKIVADLRGSSAKS